jgi:hypothetical protein
VELRPFGERLEAKDLEALQVHGPGGLGMRGEGGGVPVRRTRAAVSLSAASPGYSSRWKRPAICESGPPPSVY